MREYSYDPEFAIESRMRRLKDPLGLKSGRNRAVPARPYELKDEDRHSILKDIGGKTLGALYKFGNVLDLPVSSVRDTLSMATSGKWVNPFDQWLSPTTADNRVQSRDLLRQWGAIKKKDTWGNLAGSIALDIGLDPLTYLTFGASAGASALTKHGQLLKRAGVLDHIPSYLAKTNKAAIEAAAEGTARMVGRREAMQTIKDARQIIDSLPELSHRTELLKRLENTTKAAGYGSYDEFLAKHGDEGLQAFARFGLPNLKVLGADHKALKRTPEILLGKPGSERLLRFAKGMDRLGFKALDSPILGPTISAAKAGFMPSKMGFMDPLTQMYATAASGQLRLGEEISKARTTELVTMYDKLSGGKWSELKNLPAEQWSQEHHELRNMFELYHESDPAVKDAVDRVMGHMNTQMDSYKDLGLAVSALDDEFISRFPRQLTSLLKNDGIRSAKDIEDVVKNGVVARAFNDFMIGRAGFLKDLPGGTKQIDKIAQDPNIWRIMDASDTVAKKIRAVGKYIKRVYPDLPDEFRGAQLNRKDLTALTNEKYAQTISKTGSIYGGSMFENIMTDPNLTDIEKIARVQARLRGMDVLMSPSWSKKAAQRLSEGKNIIEPADRMFKLGTKRSSHLAGFLVSMESKGEAVQKFGLFGNHPFWDLEKSLQAGQDSITRGNLVLDVLTTPGAISNTASFSPSSKDLGTMMRELGFDQENGLRALLKRMHPNTKKMIGMTNEADIEKLAGMRIDASVAKDLGRFDRFFRAPESATYFGKIMDSFLAAFKGNVTAPFPAFHVRNLMSGQFRNMVAGSFSFRSVNQARKILRGELVEGAEQIPHIQNKWKEIQASSPALRGMELDNETANQILQYTLREHNLVAAYGGKARGVVGDVPMQSAPQGVVRAEDAIKGMVPGIAAEAPGQYAYSKSRAIKEYFGRTLEDGTRETTFGLPEVIPFHPLRALARGARKLGFKQKFIQDAAESPLFELQNVLKVEGMHEAHGFARNARQLREANPHAKLWGPVAGGMNVGHAVEFMNRIAPMMHKMEAGYDAAVAAGEVIAAQIPYGAKHYTPIENQILKRAFPFYCVPETYEILTQRGWVTHDQVVANKDMALTLNHDTGELEWQLIQRVNVFDYDDIMLVHRHKKKTRVIEWAFTPNHRWPVLADALVVAGGVSRTKKKRRWRIGLDLCKQDISPATGDYKGVESCLSPRHAAILGWIVTDGHFRWKHVNGRAYAEAVIYQSPNKYLDEIIELTGSRPRNPHPDTGVVAVNVKAVDLAVITEHFSSRKDLPGIAGRLSRESADAMWDAMFAAEGSTSAKGNQHFAQWDDYVADAFQILCYMTGRAAHRSGSGCYIRRSNGTYIGRNLTTERYTGKVWCPTTKNGTWIMRNNGAAIITGNSFTSRSLPWAMRKFMDQPGNLLTQLIRGTTDTGEMLQQQYDEGPVPSYLRDTLAIPLPYGGPEDGTKRFFTGADVMSQDLWQLLMPLMSGDFGDFGYEVAGRSNPLLIKAPVEGVTGTSLFQRGVDSGRPLRNMYPPFGGLMINAAQTWSKATGEPIPEDWIRRQMRNGPMEMLAANSPYSRYLSTGRTALDVRKSIPIKAMRLLASAGIADVSPRAQESLLREHLRKMISDEGGVTFEKATFTKEHLDYLKKNDPQQYEFAMKLKALNDERAKVAKTLQEKARMANVSY